MVIDTIFFFEWKYVISLKRYCFGLPCMYEYFGEFDQSYFLEGLKNGRTLGEVYLSKSYMTMLKNKKK